MRRLILSFILLFAVGCSTKSNPHIKPKLDLEPLEPLSLTDIKFVIINKTNSDATFEEMEQRGETPILIGLTASDYKNLAVNIKKIQNYLREQQKAFILYKEYYENDSK